MSTTSTQDPSINWNGTEPKSSPNTCISETSPAVKHKQYNSTAHSPNMNHEQVNESEHNGSCKPSEEGTNLRKRKSSFQSENSSKQDTQDSGLASDTTSEGKSDEDQSGIDASLLNVPGKCAEQAEEFVRKVWAAGLNVVHHHSLPDWLKDNEYLLRGHRLPTNSFRACFKSIFRIHTETGNIWTHLLGMIAFLGIAAYFLIRPSLEIKWQDKAVFSAFFLGAILCLTFSWVFHTVYCHSERVGRFFHKLDYCGIALLTIGSFVPWLYYSFYCRLSPKVTYLSLILFLGTLCIGVSMWDKFAQPHFRPFRAGVFVALGMSGVIPALHYVITDGLWHAFNFAAMGWLVLMALLYIVGAIIYAARIPERIFPGKCDIVFQSHQIFHVCVLAAAFVHYHGISEIANYRLTLGQCVAKELE
uniref:Adiponectin receptor n=1 Tax=Arion vulgaris TaxID=1028688 RepID=A0A0B6ZF00_9EUPU